MSLADIAQLAVAVIGAGGAGAVITKFIDRSEKREATEIERLRADIQKCEAAHEACEKKVDLMEARLRAVEASTPTHLAHWVRGQDRKLLWVNDRAYMTIFAPLGWAREDVLGKTFTELLGEGGGEALRLLDNLDQAALHHPYEVQSAMVHMHPDLPMMLIMKVTYPGADGLLRYDGSGFVPTNLAHDLGAIRQHRQRTLAAESLFEDKGDKDDA